MTKRKNLDRIIATKPEGPVRKFLLMKHLGGVLIGKFSLEELRAMDCRQLEAEIRVRL